MKNYTAQEITTKFENLLEVFDSVEIDYNSNMKKIIEIIDEKFIQQLATSKNDYYKLLIQLKEEFENE